MYEGKTLEQVQSKYKIINEYIERTFSNKENKAESKTNQFYANKRIQMINEMTK